MDESPLIDAIERGSFNDVRQFMEKENANVQCDKPLNDNKWTALMIAAEGGHIPIIVYLNKIGAGLDCVDKDGDTALHLAAFCGHVEVVRLLLNLGANSQLCNSYGWTPYDTATKKSNVECANLLSTGLE